MRSYFTTFVLPLLLLKNKANFNAKNFINRPEQTIRNLAK